MRNLISHFIILVFLLASCANKKEEKISTYGKATQELIELVNSNAEVKSMLDLSIETARQSNPDKETNPVQNLETYFEFVSYCESAMPWMLLDKPNYLEIYDNARYGLRYFYFLIDQPLAGLEGKGYYNNSIQYTQPFANWLVSFSKNWGRYLDSEDSWNDEYYQLALQDTIFGLTKGWYEDPSNWKSFNHFFGRHLRSPDQRPIASPDDHSIVVSAADSEPQGTWAIDNNSNIVSKEGVAIKSATILSIRDLIGEDSEYKDTFANGTFTHSFLSLYDYHRFHFPVGGTIKEVRLIQGINPSGGGSVTWDTKNKRYVFTPTSIGWQTIETRGRVILETDDYGLVALLPIGIGAIGSVQFEDTVKPGATVKKGDMLGSFLFGGSDFIMLFQEQAKFTLAAPIKENSTSYKHMLMGEFLGTLRLVTRRENG